MICHTCGIELDEDMEGGEWFYIYEDVNDLEPLYPMCSKCLGLEIS